MKTVGRSSLHNSVQVFQQHLSELQQPLQQRLEPELMPVGQALVELLSRHSFPGSLVYLDRERLADFIAELACFMARREQEVNSRFVDYPERNCGFLLCNCSDAPFLFDSLSLFLKRQHVEWCVVAHLCLSVSRSEQGELGAISDAKRECADESLMIVQVESGARCAAKLAAIDTTLREVVALSRDNIKMIERLHAGQTLLDDDDGASFWQWLTQDNFVPLVYRKLLLRGSGDSAELDVDAAAALGLSDAFNGLPPLVCGPLLECDELVRRCVSRQNRLLVRDSGVMSPVWRDEEYVEIRLRENSANGAIDHLFYGLYRPEAQLGSALDVPALRGKISQALERLAIAPCSYDYRKTEELLATFPKPDLFFIAPAQLDEIIKSLLYFNHDSVRIVALDNELSNLSLLLIVPRTLSPNADFKKIEDALGAHFDGAVLNTNVLQFGHEYYMLQININYTGPLPDVTLEDLGNDLTALLKTWQRKVSQLLVRNYGVEEGMRLWHRYENAFCNEYRARIPAQFCLDDIANLERLLDSGVEQIDLWGPEEEGGAALRLQFYSTRHSYLNELMPLLVNLDLKIIDEIDFTLTVEGNELYIKSFGVLNDTGHATALLDMKQRLVAALYALRRGDAENDYLNKLLVSTTLDWQQIDIFRGYRNYYFQLGSPFTKKTVACALTNNPRSAQALYDYFAARFQPDERWNDVMVREEQALMPARMELIAALEEVEDVNEDRILRLMFNLIDSSVRSNFYKRKNSADYFFSFKISAIGITEMPVPRPLYEIYVHNARMEGIHLRGGMVARGGIRWSDRPDDFRTEILGLMKTQMTKNALIVPVGSKGGFIVKDSYSSRDEGMALSKRAYQTLMRGLLDLTDNRVGGNIVPAADIVSYDSPDPYLVVAADKGTAHLPDTANAVSAEYKFWLGDGFASGGSRGYDHKALGITARGAWVCVQRHFREMGIDIQEEPFTVIGIGDMSGDVFGNGMLLSRKIRLQAAFNHLHIFLDPDPDPESSFQERQRLFNLPRSSWSDYNRELISAGGGVFERDAKEIPLSPQVQQWLGVRHETLDGDSLIQLLLKAEVDLLWNGGIGTYVKASSEKHEDAGDRANDALRIDGNQLRAKVVGEGGNLGLTQLARIEYALSGGRIDTDAVHNSAGVDCSDHEVNLKIFMQHLIEAGIVADYDERDRILGEVTDEVCQLVLANNYGQSLCLSLDTLRNQRDCEQFVDLSARLVAVGLLNRASEALPKAKEVLARSGGYTRPELSILMAYSKMHLYRELLEDPATEALDNEVIAAILRDYFPQPLAQQFGRYYSEHPLRREIIATMITNRVVDQAGAAFCFRMARRYDVSWSTAALAHIQFNQVLNADALRQAIAALDNKVPSAQQYQWLQAIEDAIAAMCDWAFSHDRSMLDLERLPQLRASAQEYSAALSGIVEAEQWEQCQQYRAELEQHGLDAATAQALAVLPHMENLLALVVLTARCGGELYPVAHTLNEVRARFSLDGIFATMAQVPQHDRWDRMTRHMLETRFNHCIVQLAQRVLQDYSGNLDKLLSAQRSAFQRYKRLSAQLSDKDTLNFHPYVVVLEQLERLGS